MQPMIGVAEQRRHRRFSFQRDVEYSPSTQRDAEPWWNGRALDLSFGGIRIISERRMHEDDLLHIRLDSETAAAGYMTTARIVHIEADAAGQWLLGCEFLPTMVQAAGSA